MPGLHPNKRTRQVVSLEKLLMPHPTNIHTNQLIHEKSPYLLQHAHNPVNWLAWGQPAFAKAASENKPIFLSIGYSTCHWCHVMERESFENEKIAEILNNHFVSIKVDREERPDVDRIYMLFVQATTGRGGWPMSVWLTPDRKPFFGGTYFPPDNRYGRPGFAAILTQVAEAWTNGREKLEASSDGILEQLRGYAQQQSKPAMDNTHSFLAGYGQFERAFDRQHGGFGAAPKFPRPVALRYLLHVYRESGEQKALEMVQTTLSAMAAGGVYDHLGQGFHRYSVDQRWFVPHFEKMLYDQAQLISVYTEAWQVDRNPVWRDIASRTIAYVLGDMTHPDGGFYSAEDADSVDPFEPEHKREGAFYVWRKAEIDETLDQASAEMFVQRYGVEPNGNVGEDPHGEFVGYNILYEARSIDDVAERCNRSYEDTLAILEKAKQSLFAARLNKPRPYLDDKVLTSWNSLMISALAKAAVVFSDPVYLHASQKALGFLLDNMYSKQTGLLLHRYRDGDAAIASPFEDYAFLAQALLDMFDADSNADRLLLTLDLIERGFPQFEDIEHGGYFSSRADDEALVLRVKEDYDGAEPAGNSIAAMVLSRVSAITGDQKYKRGAERVVAAFAGKLNEQPTSAPSLLSAAKLLLADPEQIVIRCKTLTDAAEQVKREQLREYRPNATVVLVADDDIARLEHLCPYLKTMPRQGTLTLYHCHNFACELPLIVLP